MDSRSPSPQRGRLDGIPAAPGAALGRARVVRNAADLARVLPGEVLVCPTASAVCSAVFSRAAALVTDGGGALCQAAVLAREHGLPAVVATRSATHLVRDGDLIRVSGESGQVEILRGPAGHMPGTRPATAARWAVPAPKRASLARPHRAIRPPNSPTPRRDSSDVLTDDGGAAA
ncbi:MAG: hypothetical protein J2P38_11050 [Candidatus Dormibacteraeota bacterium]|nr:hypothetical protein [Candidatus Dormibacteraeota bacterium]